MKCALNSTESFIKKQVALDEKGQLLRYSTAGGSSTGLGPVGPAKVKARKSILFTEGTPEVKINLCKFLKHGHLILQN